MNILMLSPYFPPDRGGVSDYTSGIVEEFRQQKHFVEVWSHRQGPDWRQNKQVALALEQQTKKFEATIIQFTPLAFAPKTYGVNLCLWWSLLKLRRLTGSRFIVMVHESNYPFNLTLRGLTLGPLHIFQFILLACFCDRLVFSHRAVEELWGRRLFWLRRKFKTIPVGSTIAVKESKKRPGGETETIRLTYFGGVHPTVLFENIFTALDAIVEKKGEKVELIMMGVKLEQIEKRLPRHLKAFIKCLGHVEATQVSEILQTSRLHLAPFLDGITTRRTSAMAALAHDTPLLTNRGFYTRDDIDWESCCYLAPDNRPLSFAHEALRALESKEKKSAEKIFREHFSKKQIVSQWLELMN